MQSTKQPDNKTTRQQNDQTTKQPDNTNVLIILFFRIRMTIEENGQQSKTVFLYFCIPINIPQPAKATVPTAFTVGYQRLTKRQPTSFIQSIMDDGEGLCHQSLGVIILW